MGKAKKEKRTPGILELGAGSGHDSGEDIIPKIQAKEEHARRFERKKHREQEGLLPASYEPSDAVASRRVFEAIGNVHSSSSSEAEEAGRLEEGADVKDSDGDDLFLQVKPKVGAGRDRHAQAEEDEKEAMELAGEASGNDENGSEWKVTNHNKLSKELLILGGQKKDGKNKGKSSKKSQPKKAGSSSSEPDSDKPMTEEEETNVKGKSTRSGRRKRRHGDLKMSTKRKEAYGIVKPKRPKSH